MHKLIGSLIVVLHLVVPTLLHADLYLPPAGASSPTSVIDEFVAPRKWGSGIAGLPATVTYSFVATGVGYDETGLGLGMGNITPLSSAPFPTGMMDEVREAFDAWSAVADITFMEVMTDSDLDYNTSPADDDADIRIGGHAFVGPSSTLAHAVTSFFSPGPQDPDGTLDTISTVWIDFDTAENWAIDSIGDGLGTIDVFQVAAHEIGHAIGLGHETTSVVALMDPFYSEAFTGPQADDIAGAQFLYGAAAIPEPSAFLFGGLVCSMLGLNYTRKRMLAS